MVLTSETLRRTSDAACAAILGVVCLTGAVLHNAVDPLTRSLGLIRSPLSSTVFGVSLTTWSTLHDRASFFLLVFLLGNLYWGRSWLAAVVRRKAGDGSPARAVIGVVALLAMAGWFGVATPDRDVESVPLPAEAVPLLGEESDARLGSLTLETVEARAHVPADYVRTNLGLPPDVSRATPMRELMKEHGFTIDDVRGVLLMWQIQSEMPSKPRAGK